MPRLPDLNSLGTQTAQPSRQLVVADLGQTARAAAELGQTGRVIAGDQLERQDRLEAAYAKSSLLQGVVAARQGLEQDQDYPSYQKRFKEQFGAIYEKSAGMISSAAQRQMFEAEATNIFTQADSDIASLARRKEADLGQATLLDTLTRNREAALKASDEKTREQLIAATQEAISGAAQRGYISAEEAARQRIGFTQDYAVARVDMLQPDEKARLLKPSTMPAGADEAIGFVIDNFEGTALVANDGGKGASKFGINQSANPDIDVQNLTREQAIQVYKQRYWDAIGADALPENMRLAAFDTAVNFGVTKARAMLEQAAGDPRKLADLRAAEHDRLVSADPNTYGRYAEGWKQRDAAVASLAAGDAPFFAKTGSWVDYIPSDTRAEMYQRAEIEIRRQQDEADRLNKQTQERAARLMSVNKVISGSPLDPKDKNDRQALNDYFAASLGQWQQEENVDNATLLDRSVSFATERGLIPDALQTIVRSGLRGGDAQQAILAADAVRRIRNGNPRALADFGDGDIRLAEHIGALADAGFKPEDAYQRAIDAEQAPQAQSDARKAVFKDLLKKNPSDTYIASQLNSVFSADPSVPPEMVADFNTAAESEFQRTGNMDAARAMAMNTVRRVWGRSQVGGDGLRYVRNAPETVYGRPELTAEENAGWMNEQLLADLRAGAWDDPANPLSIDRVYLTPNPASGDRPTYLVSVLDQDGVLRTQLDPAGNFLQWQPDWQSSTENVRRQVEMQSNVEAARTQRRMNAVR